PTRPPPTSTLLPYTTLFRSLVGRAERLLQEEAAGECIQFCLTRQARQSIDDAGILPIDGVGGFADLLLRTIVRLQQHHTIAQQRSEEHTSELQSRFDLVCRL